MQLEEEGTDIELELRYVGIIFYPLGIFSYLALAKPQKSVIVFEFSELEAKIEDELEKMRAKLGGRYAKYAKVSNSTELPKSTLLKPENNKSPKANPKQERNASLDEGNIKSYIEYFES